MYFINACSTISHQNSFQNKEWANKLKVLETDNELIIPNYKEFIDARDLRRMSDIIRMGIACSKDCIQQASIKTPDAIIVGTGLGCLTATEKFLKNTLTIKGLIPPTAFIQSTHNTIAGQISLMLKNHNYNITHTQNNLSFEHALTDAMLCLNEDYSDILIGAADENIAYMDELVSKLGLNEISGKLTSGASFFILSKKKNSSTQAQLIACQTLGLNKTNITLIINNFLKDNNLQQRDVDLVMSASNGTIEENEINKTFHSIPVFSFEQYCGYYFTNIAFGIHLATEILNNNKLFFLEKGNKIKRILLYNNFNNKNIGLTLLQSFET